MERRNVTVTNNDIVGVLSSYAWRSHQTVTIVSATGFISYADLSLSGPHGPTTYVGSHSIIHMIGNFEPTDPNERSENGRILIRLAGLDSEDHYFVASRLVALGTVQIEIIVERSEPPAPPPIVIGRRRFQGP